MHYISSNKFLATQPQQQQQQQQQCTLLKQHGVPCKSNTNVLIQLFGVEQYILKSRTNVVINELVQEDRSQQILLSQQTDYSWSQRSDVGFGGMGSNLEDM